MHIKAKSHLHFWANLYHMAGCQGHMMIDDDLLTDIQVCNLFCNLIIWGLELFEYPIFLGHNIFWVNFLYFSKSLWKEGRF